MRRNAKWSDAEFGDIAKRRCPSGIWNEANCLVGWLHLHGVATPNMRLSRLDASLQHQVDGALQRDAKKKEKEKNSRTRGVMSCTVLCWRGLQHVLVACVHSGKCGCRCELRVFSAQNLLHSQEPLETCRMSERLQFQQFQPHASALSIYEHVAALPLRGAITPIDGGS